MGPREAGSLSRGPYLSLNMGKEVSLAVSLPEFIGSLPSLMGESGLNHVYLTNKL